MPNSNPPVTILIPTYNREKSIGAAVESCLAQRYKRVSVLVYDDGSTDGTRQVLRPYLGGRVRMIVGRRNKGVAVGRNILLAESDTEFNCLLDSDDMMNPWKIELQMQAILKWDAPFVRTGQRSLSPGRRQAWREPPPVYWPVRQTVPTCLFRKSCSPAFNPAVQLLCDDVLWETEMTLKHGTGVVLPFVLYLSGRGRVRRMAQIDSPATQLHVKLFEKLRAPMVKKLHKQNINPYSRVEYVAPDQLELGFAIPPDKRTMPDYFRALNLATSRRVMQEKPLGIWKCPLCGAMLRAIQCWYCGRDWGPFCYYVAAPADAKDTPQADYKVEYQE